MTAFRSRVTFVLLTAVIITYIGTGFSCTDPEPGYRKVALVYGVSQYSLLNNLTFTDDDAIEMALFLEEEQYEVLLRVDDGSYPESEPATLQQLDRDISYLEGELSKEDLFLFYYAGHGGPYEDLYDQLKEIYTLPEPVPGDEPDYAYDGDEWIFLYGSLSSYSYENWDDETVNDSILAEKLQSISASKKIIVLDCCNSGGFIGEAVSIDLAPAGYNEEIPSADLIPNSFKLYRKDVLGGSDLSIPYYVLTASGELELSWESSRYGHGIFTYFFLQSKSGADSNGDGFITLLEIYQFIYRGIEEEWNALVPDAYSYSPHISGGNYDVILF